MNWLDSRAVDFDSVNPEGLPPAPGTNPSIFWALVKLVSSWALLLAVPVLVLVIGYLSADDFRLLRDSGVETTGIVESRWEWNFNRRRIAIYNVGYVFHVAGLSHTKQISVTKSEYLHLHEGNRIKVTYLPSDPGINCHGSPVSHLEDRMNLTIILAVVFGVCFGMAVARFK